MEFEEKTQRSNKEDNENCHDGESHRFNVNPEKESKKFSRDYKERQDLSESLDRYLEKVSHGHKRKTHVYQSSTSSEFEPEGTTSTPKRRKKKKSPLKEELASPGSQVNGNLIATRASRTPSRSSFQAAFLNAITQLDQMKGTDVQSDHETLVACVGKDSPVQYEIEKLSDRSFTDGERYAICAVKDGTQELSPKNKKKKKKGLELKNEVISSDSLLSSDYSINEDLNKTDLGVKSGHESNITHRKNKKKLDGNSFDAVFEAYIEPSNISRSRASELSENGESIESKLKNKHKKKKKIGDGTQPAEKLTANSTLHENLEIPVDHSAESPKYSDDADTSKSKKKKSRKGSQPADDLPTDSTFAESLEMSAEQPKKKSKRRKSQHIEELLEKENEGTEVETETTRIGQQRLDLSLSDTPNAKKKRRLDDEHQSAKDILTDCTFNEDLNGDHGESKKKRKRKKSQLLEEIREKENQETELEIETTRNGKPRLDLSLSKTTKTETLKKEKLEESALDSDATSELDSVQKHKKKLMKNKSPKKNQLTRELKKLLSKHSFDEISVKIHKEIKIEAEESEKSIKMSMLEALEAAQEKRNSNEETENLWKLNVLLPWPVHPIHMIETRLTKQASADQNAQLKALGVPIKTGNYTKLEDDRIKKNWKLFCKHHDIPKNPTPFFNFKTADGKLLMPLPERLKFGRFLAHRLEDRLLSSVYNRFRRLFTEKTRSGRYTATEDKQIMQFLRTTSSRTPYSDLAKILNRDKLSVEKRCRTLSQHIKGSARTIKWTKEKIEEFLGEFVDVLSVENVAELKDRKVTPKEWKEMSERLDLPAEKLRNGWHSRIYPKVFVQEKIFSTQTVRSRLITLLIERGEDDWRAIKWSEVAKEMAKEYQGFTEQKLSKMLRHSVNYHVPVDRRKDLKACLEFLKNKRFNTYKIKRIKIVDNRPK